MWNVLETFRRKDSQKASPHAVQHDSPSYQLPRLQFSRFELPMLNRRPSRIDLEKDAGSREEAASDTQEDNTDSSCESDPTLV